MNKRLTAAALLAASALAASAQTPYEVTGTLQDSLTKAPEAYATVRLLSAKDNKPLRAAATDSEGRFRLAAPAPGAYRVEAVTMGKAPVRRDVSVSEDAPAADCGALLTQEPGVTLGTTEVTAQKPLVKAEVDKLTYSVEDDPEAPTNTLLDMLRKVPMVTVDGEDNIKVKGQTGFKVYVNGKPNKMMSQNPSLIFKTYPASAVKKVEVVTNPGAKYDAEGVTGVLNIVTEGETKTSGYVVSPMAQVSNRDSFGSVFAMAQVGKLTFSVNAVAGGMTWGMDNKNYSEQEFFAAERNHLQTAASSANTRGAFQQGGLEASYEFSAKDLLSADVSMNRWSGRTPVSGESRMAAADGTPVYAYAAASKRRYTSTGVNAALDYQHTFAENRRLTLSYRYDTAPARQRQDKDYTLLYGGVEAPRLLDLRQKTDNLSAEHTVQADFTTPIGKPHTLSAGVKYISRLNRNNDESLTRPSGTEEAFAPDTETPTRYRHTSGVGAAYAEYQLKVKKLSLQAGGRYELFHARGSWPDGEHPAFTNRISDFVPTLALGYSLTDGQTLRAGYNLRVSRPDISCLSPYVERNAPESVSYGNPNLTSSRTNNFELSYNTFGAKFMLNATLSYSFSNNTLGGYSFLPPGSRTLNTTYTNSLRNRTVQANAYINWTVAKGTKLNVNANGGHNAQSFPQRGERNSGWAASAYGGLQQDLPWRMSASLWGGGGSRDITLQGWSSAWYFYSLTLSRKFLKEDRLRVSLSASNFLNPRTSFTNSTLTSAFRTYGRTTVNRLRVAVSVQYRLGSLNAQVKKADRTIENDDRPQKSGGGQPGGERQGGN